MTHSFKNYNHVHEVTHPLVQHKLSLLRNIHTPPKTFREVLTELTRLIVYEATKHLSTHDIDIQTPLATCTGPTLNDEHPLIIPILRAGLGMVEGFLDLIPTARVGHVGLYRDEETLESHHYYFKIPENSQENQVFICDPMLATGGSAISAITLLEEAGIERIIFIGVIAAPQGIEKLKKHYPEIPIYVAKIDEGLNAKSYIIPGIGDVGDRLHATTQWDTPIN